MNLSCAGNWIKEICEFLKISRYPLQVFHIPNVRRFYLNYFGHMNHIQRKDEGEKFLNELFSVSRGFFPFRCVWWWPIWLFPYFILFWIRRALSLLIHVLTRKCNWCHMRLGQFSIIDRNFQFNSTPHIRFVLFTHLFVRAEQQKTLRPIGFKPTAHLTFIFVL